MHYMEFVKKSFQNIKKYPVLLLPETVLFFATYFLTLALYRFSGLAEFAKAALVAGQKIDIASFIGDFAQGYMGQIIWSFAAFVFLTFIIGAGTEAIKFRMVKKVIFREHISIRDLFGGRWKDFWRIVAMKMIIYLIAMAIFLSLMLLASFVLSFSNGLSSLIAWVAIGIGIAVFVILSLGLLFRYALLFIEEQNAATTVRWSFHYFRTHNKIVLASWLITMGIALLFTFASAIATVIFTSFRGMVAVPTAIYFISFLGTVAAFGIRLIYNVWSSLFLFEVYNKNEIVL
ncbi:MAG: hypothetical protein AABX27_01190 [Nanoarchaeota archaeon]